ncbi:MAG: PAS domain S-box protein [Desulfobacterales bacterium]|nr:PAS domain S-box protein [Desulfobacterales bacterium]
MQTDRNKEILRLRNEISLLNQILRDTAVPTFAMDKDSRITHWNTACEILTGITAGDMIGSDRHQEVFYEIRRPLMADLIVRKAGLKELAMYYDGTIRRSQLIDNGYEGEDFFPKLGKWLFFTAAPLKDAMGEIVGAVETVQDISERRMAEQALSRSEARYRLLFESANDAIFLLEEGKAVDCNPKATALLKCTRTDIIGYTPLDFSPEFQPTGRRSADEIENIRATVTQLLPVVFEWRFRNKDGELFETEVSLTQFAVSGVSYGIAIVRDVTEKKRLIDTLKKSEKELDDKTRYLEKVNQALKASLDHREIEIRSVEENMVAKIKQFIFPYLSELGRCKIDTDAQAYLKIVETNLSDLLSQSSHTIFSKYIDFTPTEIRIADLIREGNDTKEIARLMGVSPSSIQWHRKHIRSKLGLTNKNTNLYRYLNSKPA